MMHGGPAAADRIRDLAGERAQHEPDAPLRQLSTCAQSIVTAQHMRTINCNSSAHGHNQLRQLSTCTQSIATAQHLRTINCDSSAHAHNQLRQLSTCTQSTATAQHMRTINCDSSTLGHSQLRQLSTKYHGHNQLWQLSTWASAYAIQHLTTVVIPTVKLRVSEPGTETRLITVYTLHV